MEYNRWRYIFPPRPELKISPDDLKKWESNDKMIFQAKFNGSNTTIYTDGITYKSMNRHGMSISKFVISGDEILNLHKLSGLDRGKWLAVNCEYLNKSGDYNGVDISNKVVIFDALIWGDYLVRKTFDQRWDILNSIPRENFDNIVDKISDNILISKVFSENLVENFKEWVDIPIIEGVVLKKRNSPLEPGFNQKNNIKWSIKCRKATKNYSF